MFGKKKEIKKVRSKVIWKLEDLKKYLPLFVMGFVYLIVQLVMGIKGEKDVLQLGIGTLIGFSIALILIFTFGKLNKRYFDNRIKEKDDEE